MIYLIDGSETYKMRQKKTEILAQKDLLPENISTFDASSSSFDLKRALSSCATVSLFSEKRAVVLDSPFFLRASKGTKDKTDKKSKGDSAADLLRTYCENPVDECELIFYCFEYDADKRKKEYKALEEFFGKTVTHIHFGQVAPYDFEPFVDKALQQRQIRLNREARKELLDRIAGSTTQLYIALDKIDLYGQKVLDKNDIEHLVSVNPNVNIWKFSDAYLKGNSKEIMNTYEELLMVEKLTPLAIIPLLSFRLKTVFHAVRMDELNMSLERMRKYSGKQQIDKDLAGARGMSSRSILGLLDQLATLDQDIKKGKIGDKEGFEQFLLRRIEQCNH